MDETTKRPWWRKKRWRVAIPVWIAASYAAGFVPACWALVRVGPGAGPGWAAAEQAYRPVAVALMASPPWAQQTVAAAVNAGLPPGVGFRIHPVSTVAVYSSHPTYGRAVVQIW